ncbi:MAG: hypothetical protein N2Z21_04030, partial [Candidatus Sumerlaeaceae bacterium]|nr:hypothetical protein [Candidatus Sumerlaeaceae bacterium]
IDESARSPFLAVGGVLAEWDRVLSLVRDWRAMKSTLKLPEDQEVKWKTKVRDGSLLQLQQKAVEFIVKKELRTIVCVMTDKRKKRADDSKQGGERDFYCEALKYVVQRVQEISQQRPEDVRSCVVICDTPGLNKERKRESDKKTLAGSIRRGQKAVLTTYAEWYKAGTATLPEKKTIWGPLTDNGFHPSMLIGDATYHDMLQIADVVVGATGEWVATVNKNKELSTEHKSIIKTLSRSFLQDSTDRSFWGKGFILWPPDEDLWKKLKNSLG